MKPFAVLAFAALLAIPAQAAEVSIVSMHYSNAHPVPHIHYEGDTLAGDVQRIQQVIDSFVHCRLECATHNGRSIAVMTMKGPGGDYHEGLRIADFLRANNIATVVEKAATDEDGCYSACAFSFLGGTGYSSSDRIGPYVDRVLEPGGILGFHSPYRDENSLAAVLAERAPIEVMAENRDALSLMVKELVRWNVDPEIIHHMLSRGPSQFYYVSGADDYYLTRTALPPLPSSVWIAGDIPGAVRNACIKLLAMLERADPLELANRITTPFEQGIGYNTAVGSLSGYRLSNRLLDIGHCSASDASIATGSDLNVALYWNPGVEGISEPALSLSNQDNYFSAADLGGAAVKRVFQRGGLGYWFLPVKTPVGTLENISGLLIQSNKFFSIRAPELPPPQASFTVDETRARSRVSHLGNVWLFEQVGSTDLFNAAAAETATGVTLTHDSVTATGISREGYHADGTHFSVVAFQDGSTSIVTKLVVVNGGQPPTDAERGLIRQVACGVSWSGTRLAC